GGPGADFIVGGLGNDEIDGGEGGDYLSGGQTLGPDAYELVSRSFGSGTNDTFRFAADLPTLTAESPIGGLSFHDGDVEDWYIIRAEARQTFLGQSAATITKDMIRVFEIDQQTGEKTGNELGFSLLLAENTGTEEEPTLVPIEVLPGASEAFLLRVENRFSGELNYQNSARLYQLEFSSPLGDSVETSIAHLTSSGSGTGYSRSPGEIQIRFDGENIGGQGVFNLIGDFNGVGLQDFVVAIQVRGDSTDGSNFARIVYGGDPLLDPAAGDVTAASGTLLMLPGLLTESLQNRSPLLLLPAGDIDGDGADDLLYSDTAVSGAKPLLIFGSTETPALLAVRRETGLGARVFEIQAPNDQYQALPIGDVNNDGLDDFVINDLYTEDNSFLFYGKTRSELIRRGPVGLPQGAVDPIVQVYDFETSVHSFDITDNDVGKELWTRSNGRLVLGGPAGYVNSTFGQSSKATAKTPLIPLASADPVLTFDHLLLTDQAGGFDIARVFVETEFGERTLIPGASNQGNGLLEDGMDLDGA
ncbi:MAG: hypothetical protein JJ992_03335, partial [Planctomycetes bacterium]|nr:hypothetical protein [Planctomycetota bacterium]